MKLQPMYTYRFALCRHLFVLGHAASRQLGGGRIDFGRSLRQCRIALVELCRWAGGVIRDDNPILEMAEIE
jgi:hypothetical protein